LSIKIGILNPGGVQRGTQRALESLMVNLEKQNIFVNFCLYSDRIPSADIMIGAYNKSELIQKLVDEGTLRLARAPQALCIQEAEFEGSKVLFVCGYDAEGLTYALYELAERVSSQSVINIVDPLSEEPALVIREIFTFFNNFALDSVKFYSPEYWEKYFSLMAKNRLNTFTLIFGYHNSNFIPFLPQFVEVPELEEVEVTGITKEDLTKNQTALKIISETALDYGIDFNLGIWKIKPCVQIHPLEFLEPRVRLTGLAEEDYPYYTYLALKKVIAFFPGIKGFALRKTDTGQSCLSDQFLLDTFGKALAENGHTLKLKLYEGDFLPETIEKLISDNVKVHISTKYEQSAPETKLSGSPPVLPIESRITQTVPYHEIWDCGSHRILLWGDPDYLRSVTQNLKSLKSKGLALTPHLALKGFDNGKGLWDLLCPLRHYYTWEFERYWYFYLLCGRILYNPGTSGQVLLREFNRRFGNKGSALAEIYHLASQVLSTYVKFHTSGEPLESWTEIDTGGVLDVYYQTPTANNQIFSNCQEYVEEFVENKPSGRVSPRLVALRLKSLGQEILDKVHTNQAAPHREETAIVQEWKISLNDFLVLGHLALYHSAKIQAAINLGLFYQTEDLTPLLTAATHLQSARRHWEKIVSATDEVYYHWMVTGPLDSGHWRTKLPLIREDENRIYALINERLRSGHLKLGFDFGGFPPLKNPQNPDVNPALTEYHVEKGYIFVDDRMKYNSTQGYGWEKSGGLIGLSPPSVRLIDGDLNPMCQNHNWDKQGSRRRPYGNQLYNDLVMGYNAATFRVDLQPGTYRIQVILCDQSPEGAYHGPMSITLNDRLLAENLTAPTGKKITLSETIELNEGLLLGFNSPPEGDWFISALEINEMGPIIKHSPSHWIPEEELVIKTSVFAINQIEQVNLYWRTESETQYKMLPMLPGSAWVYETKVEPKPVWGEEQIYYYITASDGKNKAVLGSAEKPYVVRWGREDNQIPYCYHTPPSRIENSTDLTLELNASEPDLINRVNLCCRRIDFEGQQDKEYLVMPMEAAGENFQIEISHEYLDGADAFVYYFQIITRYNTGFVFPDPFQSGPGYLIRINKPADTPV